MREPIPKDLAEAFENAVLKFVVADCSAPEPVAEFRGQNESLSALCFMAAQFDDPLPESVAAKLRARLYAEHDAPFKAGLGGRPSYARAALCLRILTDHRAAQPSGSAR